jgi:hypothetical protein
MHILQNGDIVVFQGKLMSTVDQKPICQGGMAHIMPQTGYNGSRYFDNVGMSI